MNIQYLLFLFTNHNRNRNAMMLIAAWIRMGDITHHQLQSITSVTLRAMKTMVRMVDQAMLVFNSALLLMIMVLMPL